MEYKVIDGFSNYEVNDRGDVRNVKGWSLSPYTSSIGYRHIQIKDDGGVRRSWSIHRLVVTAFLGPIPAKMWVNHKNGIKGDNRLENLEVVTPSENHCHARDVLKRKWLRGSDAGPSKLTKEGEEAVVALSQLGWSQHRIAKAFTLSQVGVLKALRRLTSPLPTPDKADSLPV